MSDPEHVCATLALSESELNSLYVSDPVDGHAGTEVAQRLADRFGLDVAEPLGRQLAAAGILTEEEGRWLDDAD